jgi:deoxycytidine triphosphate deaminase
MPRLIPERELKVAVIKGTFIKNGVVENAESVKYDFRMGSRVLKAKYQQPIDLAELAPEDRASLCVEPGEVVFALTEERLDLPKNVIATLSPKRKLSHDGILVLGGFCVDPLYRGRLLVGMYNFSSTRFPLRAGKKLIAAIFYELSDAELDQFKPPEAAIEDFPDELTRLMQSYTPVSNTDIVQKMLRLQADFEALRAELHDREDWFNRFEEAITKHDALITRILDGLEKEKDQRVDAETSLRREIGSYARRAYMTAGIVGTLGALIISLIVYLIQKIAAQ